MTLKCRHLNTIKPLPLISPSRNRPQKWPADRESVGTTFKSARLWNTLDSSPGMPLSTKPKPTTRSPTMSPRRQTNCVSGFSYFLLFFFGRNQSYVLHSHLSVLSDDKTIAHVGDEHLNGIFPQTQEESLVFFPAITKYTGGSLPQAGISSLQQFHPNNQVYRGGCFVSFLFSMGDEQEVMAVSIMSGSSAKPISH